jgi:hypothetical protein
MEGRREKVEESKEETVGKGGRRVYQGRSEVLEV